MKERDELEELRKADEMRRNAIRLAAWRIKKHMHDYLRMKGDHRKVIKIEVIVK